MNKLYVMFIILFVGAANLLGMDNSLNGLKFPFPAENFVTAQSTNFSAQEKDIRADLDNLFAYLKTAQKKRLYIPQYGLINHNIFYKLLSSKISEFVSSNIDSELKIILVSFSENVEVCNELAKLHRRFIACNVSLSNRFSFYAGDMVNIANHLYHQPEFANDSVIFIPNAGRLSNNFSSNMKNIEMNAQLENISKHINLHELDFNDFAKIEFPEVDFENNSHAKESKNDEILLENLMFFSSEYPAPKVSSRNHDFIQEIIQISLGLENRSVPLCDFRKASINKEYKYYFFLEHRDLNDNAKNILNASKFFKDRSGYYIPLTKLKDFMRSVNLPAEISTIPFSLCLVYTIEGLTTMCERYQVFSKIEFGASKYQKQGPSYAYDRATLERLEDPWTTGRHSYEREAICMWAKHCKIDPVDNNKISENQLQPNKLLKLILLLEFYPDKKEMIAQLNNEVGYYAIDGDEEKSMINFVFDYLKYNQFRDSSLECYLKEKMCENKLSSEMMTILSSFFK